MRRQLLPVFALVVLVVLLLAAGCGRGRFVGSDLSDRYHEPGCTWAKDMDADRQVWFATAEAAEAAEYRPCRTCLDGE